MKSLNAFHTVIVTLLALFSLAVRGYSEDSGPSPAIPELQALSHYVGRWDVTLFGADGGPSMKGESSAKWVLDGRFVEQNGVLKSNDGNRIAIRTLYTYDAEKRVYRSWSFVSSGSVTESEATWDAKAKTMTSLTRPDPNGNKTKIIADFSAAGVETWRFLSLDRNGQQVSEFSGKNIRKDENKNEK